VSYRPWLEERALRQMGGLPAEALDVLARALARICEDPYDRLFSRAVRDDDPRERMAELVLQQRLVISVPAGVMGLAGAGLPVAPPV
jgi:hypothetical protein